MNEKKGFSLLQLELKTTSAILISIAIMAVLITAVYAFNIPNPNMILIAGLVVCSAMFGYPGGLTSGVIMFFYTLFFFSTDHDFHSFTPQNLQKVGVSLFGILADMIFVCELKRSEIRAFQQIKNLTRELSEDNTLLQQVSRIDVLTGIRNRYAFRCDYNSYIQHNVHVMFLDIDNFKLVNDTYGHDAGDIVLAQTGKNLSDIFGQAHSYRYGGDEFMVIVPDLTEDDFRQRILRLRERCPQVAEDTRVSYSIGYTHGFVRDGDQLREMLSIADENMYASKHAGKAAGSAR